MWTYESRQGRKAATAVCFASAAVTLVFPKNDEGRIMNEEVIFTRTIFISSFIIHTS